MKPFIPLLLFVGTAGLAQGQAPVESKAEIKDGVIYFFQKAPKHSFITRNQIDEKQLWVSGTHRHGKTRQIVIHNEEGGRGKGVITTIRFHYPFGDASANWNRGVKRTGDIVTVKMMAGAKLIGDILDPLEDHENILKLRKKLGVSDPADSNLPVVYCSGDSICGGYWPYLEAALQSVANVYHQAEVAKDNPKTRPKLSNNGHAHLAHGFLVEAYKHERFQPDFLLVNFGLHMLSNNPQHQEKYGEWVNKFIAYAKAKETKLIFVTTTPYRFRLGSNKLVIKYNAMVREAASANKVPIVDLHSATLNMIKELGLDKVYKPDGVHFTEEARKRQAEFIAAEFKRILGK